jgi:hypothetical protein
MLYADALVEIDEEAIVLKRYVFPFGSRRVRFADVQRVTVETPRLLNGRWRLWGANSFRTWFPFDLRRPFREAIFFIEVSNRWTTIGFTAEDAKRVAGILRARGLIRSTDAAHADG